MKVICLDIGGTNIKSALFINKKIKKTFSVPTHGKEGLEVIKEYIGKSVEYYLEKEKNVDYIAISSAGNIDPFNGKCVYASDNLVGFSGFEIQKFIEEKYKISCKVNNDAVCHLIAILNKENYDKNIFMITLGTGVGAVLYKNSEIFYGNDFDLGKFAHKVIVENGCLCDCGQKGCAEKEISSNYFDKITKVVYGKKVSTKDVFLKYMLGNTKSKQILETYFFNVNEFIKYIETLGVDLIYISGGIASSKCVFKKFIKNPKVRYVKNSNLLGVQGALKLVELL